MYQGSKNASSSVQDSFWKAGPIFSWKAGPIFTSEVEEHQKFGP